MKNLLKLPVLLLAVMLVASCGDSKKEEEEKKLSPAEQAAADAKKVANLECERDIASLEGDFDKAAELEEQINKMNDEMNEKWDDKVEEDEKIRDAVIKAFDKVAEECEEKIDQVTEEQRSIGTKDAEEISESLCKMLTAQMDGDPDAADKFQKENEKYIEELEKKYGANGSASDIAKSAYTEALNAVIRDCM